MSDPKYLFGIHDGEHADARALLKEKGRIGWILLTFAIGHNPNDVSGANLQKFLDEGFGVIVRLNNGYGDAGTIPLSADYDAFATRVKNFCDNSPGAADCIIQIGNEMNHADERPDNVPITPSDYAECFEKCVKAAPEYRFAVGPIAPWNNQTAYEGNESGDWVQYLADMLRSIVSRSVTVTDIIIHAYTHGSDPSYVFSESRDSWGYYWHFRHYKEQMDTIDSIVPNADVYIGEADQNDAWANVNSGWVQNVYKEIHEWNEAHDQQIKCVILYCWTDRDKWCFANLGGVHDDLRDAMDHDYVWRKEQEMIIIGSETFEGTFVPRDDPYTGETNVGELKVHEGWEPYWVWQGANPPDPSLLRRPEFFIAPGEASAQSQAVQTTFSTTDCCVWKKFPTIEGATLVAEVAGMIDSADGAQHGLQMGIDPLGGTDMFAASVKWSEWLGQNPETDKEWQTLTAEAIALASQCTIFLRSKNDYAKNTAGHFDNFILTSNSEVEPEPPEPPEPGDGDVWFYIDRIRKATDDLENYLLANQKACILLGDA